MSTVCTGFYFHFSFFFYFYPILIENSVLIKYGAVWFLCRSVVLESSFIFFLSWFIFLGALNIFRWFNVCLYLFARIFSNTQSRNCWSIHFLVFFSFHYLHLHVSACVPLPIHTDTHSFRLQVRSMCVGCVRFRNELSRCKYSTVERWMRITSSECYDCVWAFGTFSPSTRNSIRTL